MNNIRNHYTKPEAQLKIEALITVILRYSITITEMEEICFLVHQSLSSVNSASRSGNIHSGYITSLQAKEIPVYIRSKLAIECNDALKICKLSAAFKNALTDCIRSLTHEKAIHDKIIQMVQEYGGRYDSFQHEYDVTYKIISDTYSGLYNALTKGENKGRVRIDTYLDSPAKFYANLRAFISNNIITDTCRALSNERKYIEPLTYTTEDGTEILKPEDLRFNSHIRFNTLEENSQLILTDDINCQNIIEAILDRFLPRKPVAAYIVFRADYLEDYDTLTECDRLSSQKFSTLFHDVLDSLEDTYPVNLLRYKEMNVSAEKYIHSFCSASRKTQRDRIDKLLSAARKEVGYLDSVSALKKAHGSSSGKYFCL